MSDLMPPDVQDDPALAAEVDRLLARRTREISLGGEIERLFRA
ncbi:GGDEF domain-containing protein, partial [Mesorhizobium sp. M7A.F.Ca.AU.001.01.1.1]